MNSLTIWQECYAIEKNMLCQIIEELKVSKRNLERLPPERWSPQITQKAENIERYLNTLEGLMLTIKGYWMAMEEYFQSTYESYSSMIEELEFHKTRATQLEKIIHHLKEQNHVKK
ncbi:hypothetical protein [Arcticibacterium luteifluviistationis]|uniref:Uncharacterized protein n=1 Tax=Arcticibacterium luteifluviistationis TaxID=1784714 RepID=A0A2Z4GBN1_9BACT|nr:hypothetical protein [Arcticibacterium luteifluviistationis]AWV98478.1 hypothetical protein DJ013_09960 [Arcticibacterium luteifluviistationis]